MEMSRRKMLSFLGISGMVPFVERGSRFAEVKPAEIKDSLPIGQFVYFFNPRAVDFDALVDGPIVPGMMIPVHVRPGMRVSDEVACYQIGEEKA